VPTYYNYPEDPPQLGSSDRPELFEARFWSCVYRNGSLWAVHHHDRNRVRARWYEFRMNGWPASGTPELVQSGEIDPGDPVRTFFPSIWVDYAGNAVITCARSSPSEYISMCWAYRMADDPLGEFRSLRFVKESSAPYHHARWGDYSGTASDPTEVGKFWGHHEYCPWSSSWNTWVAEYTAETCSDKGDINQDCHRDVDDWADFATCVGGPTVSSGPDCTCYDFDNDDRVDLIDYSEFQNQFTGPSATIPDCVP
jgi:hypothetical protein